MKKNDVYRRDYLYRMDKGIIPNNDYAQEFNQDYKKYLSNLKAEKRKEKAFTEVLEKQSQYSFLGHGQRTPQEEKKVMENIADRVKKLQSKVMIFLMAIMMAFTTMSCEKDNYKPPVTEIEMISQSFKIKTILEQDMTTKAFDPATFIPTYNPTPAVLTLECINDPTLIFTRQTTIQELINGTVTMQVVPETYRITYATIHGATNVTNNMDISIDETEILNGAPVTLDGILEDFLIIYDIPNSERGCPIVSVTATNGGGNLSSQNGYWYGYANLQTNLYITYSAIYPPPSNQMVLDPPYTQIMPTMTKGILYWVLRPVGGTFTINIPDLKIERILV